jgi:hypothetical protein
VKDAIEKLDGENLKGVADAPSSGRNWWVRISQDVHWVTLMDMGTMGKEAWEDILRLWKRRGENARGKFGEALTGWIPSWIPYASQLKHEFHRRQQDSELASVQVWEKALENVDAYALIESFDRVTIKDQLKATLIRLTKLGRLDWGEVKLWRALNRFSHFNIPKQECQRDPVLLDKYLQKVIADIWGDKDLYRTWKTSNESAYKSNRDAYEGVADDLSAHGLLGSQLKYMLETFVRAKKAGRPISDQVNPHLYEQLVLYAMLKGKMSMQEKFFYLIMGVRHGLIPFERLSILVGQISMETFPFIDYFYGHNNTRKEITEIAESIEEEFNPFKPGVKTTAFLMEEVVRDETARQRVVKCIDRVGNRMDHEDVPTAAAFLRAGSWDKFLIVSSGQLQRVTEEGLKNAYVGFSTLFKSYGIIAEKKAAHGQHFSSSDSRFLAERLIAYMHYDNVVARQATDNTSRPELSYGAIDNETMPSGSNRKPREFRDPMNDLAYAVFSAYRDQIKRFQPREQLVDDEDEPIDFEKYEKMYFAFDENGKRRREIIGKGSAKGKRIHKMTYEMEDAFSAAVQSDGGALLMRILREHKDHLINEGGDENKLSYEVHKDFFGRQKRFTHAPNGSFPHYVAAA